MEQYNVTGMSCAACSARVEKAVNGVAGVTSCSVSLLTNSMGVEGTANPKDIIAAVQNAGYGASLKNGKKDTTSQDDLEDKETPKLLRRFVISLSILVVLMYFSMGHMMWNWPIPTWFMGNHVAMGLLQMLLAIMIMIINQKFFISGFKALWHRAPNMDTLVAMGSMAAFVYSTFALFLMTDAVVKGNDELVMVYMDEFYFESAATILTLITVGKTLEARSKGKTTDALKGLMKLAPKQATLLKNGEEVVVSIDQVHKGDHFIVKPGQSVPVDGIVLKGNSAIDESALTGESIPVDKQEGSLIYGATINQSGYIECEALQVGEDTTLSKIIEMVSDAAATKAPIAKIADQVSGVFVPAVMTIATVTFIAWMLFGQTFGFALARAISVLVISCPCALGLATPVAIMVGNGVGAKNGILFKNAVSQEAAGRIDIVALDKTGTITEGKPTLRRMDDFTDNQSLFDYAYALESKSEHPLSKAIVNHPDFQPTSLKEVDQFEVLPGLGLQGLCEGKMLRGGNEKFISQYTTLSNDIISKANTYADQGLTPLYFALDEQLLGIIVVGDVIKADSAKAIHQLKQLGIEVVMLTGDNERTANAIGKEAGVDLVYAGVMPQDKERIIRELKAYGKVAMVGDGINDAPALTRADIGIAIGAGTDIAIDAANIVLMKSNLLDVAALIRLSRATLKNIHENLFWAFFYNCIGIPLAAGLLIPIFHWQLNPMFGAAAMSLSSFCVVSNALRLNLVKLYDNRHDHPKKRKAPLEIQIQPTVETTVIKVEGMMCEHCERTVKETLEAIEGIQEATPSFELGEVILKLNGALPEEAIALALEKEDYQYVRETITIKVEGMMCEHCERTVKETLEAIEGIQEAIPSFELGEVILKLNGKELPLEAMKEALEKEDYQLVG